MFGLEKKNESDSIEEHRICEGQNNQRQEAIKEWSDEIKASNSVPSAPAKKSPGTKKQQYFCWLLLSMQL